MKTTPRPARAAYAYWPWIAEQWGTTVPGHVDARVIARLWQRLEEKGLADEVRRTMLPGQRLR